MYETVGDAPCYLYPLVDHTGTIHSTWLRACVKDFTRAVICVLILRVVAHSGSEVRDPTNELICSIRGLHYVILLKDRVSQEFGRYRTQRWFRVIHRAQKALRRGVHPPWPLKPTGVLLFLKCGRFPCERKETWSFGATESEVWTSNFNAKSMENYWTHSPQNLALTKILQKFRKTRIPRVDTLKEHKKSNICKSFLGFWFCEKK